MVVEPTHLKNLLVKLEYLSPGKGKNQKYVRPSPSNVSGGRVAFPSKTYHPSRCGCEFVILFLWILSSKGPDQQAGQTTKGMPSIDLRHGYLYYLHLLVAPSLILQGDHESPTGI